MNADNTVLVSRRPVEHDAHWNRTVNNRPERNGQQVTHGTVPLERAARKRFDMVTHRQPAAQMA